MTAVADNLRARYLDFDLHRPVIDEAEGTATFYLWNLSGCPVGYHQYRPGVDKKAKNHPKDSRYYTHRTRSTLTVWGVESLVLTPHVVFLTEGVFDAARLTHRGYSALAALTNVPGTDLRNWLSFLNRRIVVVADNDRAGQLLHKHWNGGAETVSTQDKDLGDSDDSYVTWLLDRYGR